MRISRLEIRWHRVDPVPRVEERAGEDLDRTFAISDQDPFWRAIHKAIDALELETLETARLHTANPNLCIADVGASEGVAMVRLRLNQKRANALREQQFSNMLKER
jgi:hypothetical protein